MGVPKFFRWLSERYPKINQRQTFLPKEETFQKYYGNKNNNNNDIELPPVLVPSTDVFSECGLPPEIDNLYIDANGVLHGCSHNNGSVSETMTRHDIFTNVAYYLDRIISDIVQPKKLVYIAIDGAAPRAKLNQQRARRYRGGIDELEQSIYEEYMETNDTTLAPVVEESCTAATERTATTTRRFKGKFQTQDDDIDDDDIDDDDDDTTTATSTKSLEPEFHLNAITPGTEFFAECTLHLEHWIQYKLSTDPKWQHLEIIFSGPNTPGEGEHKIMEYLRHARASPDYNPALRHAIMGQDADLILLGLVTHEPNLVILRERVIFEAKQREMHAALGLNVYLHNCHYEWLHMSVLRDYIMYELETEPVVMDGWDRERTIDDFIFLTLFVGNDFLPHMPALDIGDDAFDLLFHVYKRERKYWLKAEKQQHGSKHKTNHGPYLTHAGTIVSGSRLEHFLQQLGSHEVSYYQEKRQSQSVTNERMRKVDAKNGWDSTIPPDVTLQKKEDADRTKYRDMMASNILLSKNNGRTGEKSTTTSKNFRPVLSDATPTTKSTTNAIRAAANTTVFQPQQEDELEEGFLSRMGSLLKSSIGDERNSSIDNSNDTNGISTNVLNNLVDDQDLKGRYYYDKFKFTPFDAEQHYALRKAYVEGLVWNLKYYYEGCVSWSWYYPYHYGPMTSDIVGIQGLLDEINESTFTDPGVPLKPFEQLMGCMPPSSAKLLPEPYRWLMTNQETSPLADFYPRSFTVDMNGKRWPWEAVVLLPFLDAQRLVQTATKYVTNDDLTPAEIARNELKDAVVYYHDEKALEGGTATTVPALPSSSSSDKNDYCASFVNAAASRTLSFPSNGKEKPVFEPVLADGVVTPSPGFPSLMSAPIQSLWRRRMGVNVFNLKSRYKTAILEVNPNIPKLLPDVKVMASSLIGTTVYINYPFLVEGFVTALSNPEMTIRGKNAETVSAPKYHSLDEMEVWKHTMATLTKKLECGEGYGGSAGGWKLPDSQVLISVRPLKEVVTTPNGDKAKVFAKFEVTVPLLAALWSPQTPDPRTANLPALLEKDPYFFTEQVRGKQQQPPRMKNGNKSSKQKQQRILPPDRSPPAIPSINTATPISGLMSSSNSPGIVSSLQGTTTTSTLILPPLQGKRGYTTAAAAAPNKTGFLNHSFTNHGYYTPPTKPLPRRTVVTTATLPAARRHHVVANLKSRRSFVGIAAAAAVVLFGMGCDASSHSSMALPSHLSVSPPPLQFEHGTTTLSFIFQGGIIAAVDSRASLGNFVGSKTVQKVLPIHSHMLGTMAGGAADCRFWIRRIQAEAELFCLQRSTRMSVGRASRLLSNALYENRGAGLSIGTMIMGFDDKPNAAPIIYYVDSTGVRMKSDMFSVGSGSTFALGILDEARDRFNLSRDEAIALGIKAIRHATFRDAYSGGFINVYLITAEKGWEKVFTEDLASRRPASAISNGDLEKKKGE